MPDEEPKHENLNDITDDFLRLLIQNAREAGEQLVDDINSVREYAAQRMVHLSRCVHEPGFDLSLRAERDNIALKAAARAVSRADDLDGRVLGFIEGAILMASRALVIAA